MDINKCVRTDEYGKSLYDIRAVYMNLLNRQIFLEKQGSVATNHDHLRIKKEMMYVLNDLLEKNQRIENLAARIHCIYSWCQITRTALSKCFELLPSDTREEKIFELLATIFPKINAPNAASDIVEILAHVILALTSKLRHDRKYQSMRQAGLLASESFSQNLRLPVDSLQQVVLKGILDNILKPDSTNSLRSTQYAALLNYLQYTQPDDLILQDNTLGDSLSKKISDDRSSSSYRTSLLVGNLAIINSYGDKLFDVLCRDASDGNGLWRTIAFSALEALYTLSSHEKPNRILNFMVKRNFLSDFVRVLIQREDSGLSLLLRSEPGIDLFCIFHSFVINYCIQVAEILRLFFIFESKMSLFIRIAQHKEGVEKLLDSGIVETLTDCKFIDERPEVDSDDMGN